VENQQVDNELIFQTFDPWANKLGIRNRRAVPPAMIVSQLEHAAAPLPPGVLALAAAAGFAIWAFGRRGPEGKRKAPVRSKRQIEHSEEDESGLRLTE
jgi:hypothetical protein